jgi:nucleoside triphosphate pyrophosphatase
MVAEASRLVLASRSPQRRAILEALGVTFVTRPADFAETDAGAREQVAQANALGKALAVNRAAGEVVLGVDTVVSLAGRIHGKPRDAAAARETLRALSGATHAVVSGLALVGLDDSPRLATCATEVTFRFLAEPTIDWYLASGEWRERAGGYAIQGAGCALVESISGDWTNVVGLPVGTLLDLHPGLLTARTNRFTASDNAELQH